MKKDQVLKKLLEKKLVAIVRGVGDGDLEPLFSALYDGGVRFAEITFDQSGKTPDAATAANIKRMADRFSGKMHVGAGTVLSVRQARLAHEAGAGFLISPSIAYDVIKYCSDNGLVSMPGAMTPTEIVSAYDAGADLVKLFPSENLGLSYIKAVSAPLSHIPLFAVGGVNVDNISEFLSVVKGVGIGSGIVKKELVAARDFAGITALAKKFTEKI